MKIAVIGAGLTGVLVSLRLADADHDVHLFDRAASPLLGASGSNEGKLHKGYVYPLDGSLRTARTMLAGAAAFQRILEPWVGHAVFSQSVSKPFIYAVVSDSMLSASSLKGYYARVAELDRTLDGGERQPGAVREMTSREVADTFNPSRVTAAFLTDEVAIDAIAVRAGLLDVIAGLPRIVQRMQTDIEEVRSGGRGYVLRGAEHGGWFSEDYDVVVNAAWEQRLWIDATLGLDPPHTAIHRYKCGLRTKSPSIAARLPSVTFVVGPYGDTVSYGQNAYVSWYPAGLLSQETGLRPQSPSFEASATTRTRVIMSTLRSLADLMPGVGDCFEPDETAWGLVGGYITAWGTSGIEDPRSRLHDRYSIGVHSSGNYHSIDTGKYTMAPFFAEEASRRILKQDAGPIP